MDKEIIKRLNANPVPFYAIITGGGTSFISEYLKVTGGSSTFIGAEVPYAMEMVDNLLFEPPQRYCSKAAALALSKKAHEKARQLNPVGDRINKYAALGSIGIGVTCSLAYEGQREGRKNRIFVAIDGNKSTYCLEAEFRPGSTREEQENQAARVILDCLYHFRFGEPVKEISRYNDLHTFDWAQANYLNHAYKSSYPNDFSIIFPGSFNPLHDGHREMASIAKRVVAEIEDSYHNFYYEISAKNFSKPDLDALTIGDRVSQSEDDGFFVSYLPYFGDKINEYERSFASTYVVMGHDTYQRIVMEHIQEMTSVEKVKFLIFGVDKEQLPDHSTFVKHDDLSNFKSDIRSKKIRNSKK